MSPGFLFTVSAIVSTFIVLTCSFPLRQVGVKKNIVRHMSEGRDPVLCWTVQINTLKSCKCLEDNIESSDCCREQNYILEHLLALTDELNLEIHHTFGTFHDHFVLCHRILNQKNIQWNWKTSSELLKQIHSEHSKLRTTDQILFEKYKTKVEENLSEHEEILWFSSEYVHWRRSRSVSPKHGLQHRPVNLHHQDTFDERISSYNILGVRLEEKYNVLSNKSSSTETIQPYLSDDSETIRLVHSSQKSVVPHLHYTHLGDQFNNSTASLRHMRSVNPNFNDPAYPKQWHLKNNAEKGMDINVTGLWLLNYTGTGVTVAVVDDGVEWTNPDLNTNYNYKGSWDLNSDDPDPSPSSSKTSNHHGTRCAGEIAATANNRICGIGVAYGAQFSGLRVLDGAMTDSMEAEAFNKKMDVNDIYSCSWGPDDDGKTVDGPHLMAAKAMKYGVDFGRQGYGSIYVVASGNGGEHMDNCNFDGYANSIYTLTVGAVDENGKMPYYAEECASMLGVTFSSGTQRDIVTTDWTVGKANGCTDSHTGTSAAAPLAAGMIALMLQARYCLTWRDVQYIIILTSQKVDTDSAHFDENGAGLSHSHKHGFGLLNSWRLVNAARVWETVPWLTSYSHADPRLSLTIPKSLQLNITYTVSDENIQGLGLFTLESVQLTVSLSHPFRGMLEIQLISPASTRSVLAAPRPLDNSSSGFTDWTFTTVRCWGEQPQGNWTVIFIDKDSTSSYGHGTVSKLRLTLFGTPMTSNEFAERRLRVEAAMSGQFLQPNYSLPCSVPQMLDDSYVPVSDKVLKFILLSGAFCFLMALYETFEYLMCYNDEKKEAARNRQLTHRAQPLIDSTVCSTNSANPAATSLSNGATVFNSSNISSLNVLDVEDEDDVFDMDETSTLIRPNHRNQLTTGNIDIQECIPLSTFSFNTPEDIETVTDSLLTQQSHK